MIYTNQPSPKQRYQSLVSEGAVNDDLSQQQALNALEALYLQLGQVRNKKNQIKGVYLWGKVGRGKTMLLNIFAASLKPEHCLRLHFHHFMASIHQQLRKISGNADPLKIIAKKISAQYKVICFDEFFVTDIGDAMLLGKLMQYLFIYQVTLVTSSNTAPERLYWAGLQRERFLPAIQAILTHTQSIHLDGLKDHRARTLQQAEIYFIEPNEPQKKLEQINQLFTKLALPSLHEIPETVTVLGRKISYRSRNNTSICFDFSQICEGPRSHFDYIEIAKRFDTILILSIPPLGGQVYERIKARGTEDGSHATTITGAREVMLAPMDDATRRFIALIDELYERKVKLFLTSPVALNQLYTQGTLTFEFERVRSRLLEMASIDYQQLCHLG